MESVRLTDREAARQMELVLANSRPHWSRDADKSLNAACSRDRSRPWVTDGVSFPHGTPFRAKYKGFYYAARVEDGALLFRGRRFHSPSAACFAVTANPHFNGWFLWECKVPGNASWLGISNLKPPQ